MTARIFISYSRVDDAEKKHLVTQLNVLEGDCEIETWTDDRIPTGSNWIEAIEDAVARANYAVLLVSANFLSSRFIDEEEVPLLLQQHADRGLTIMPIIGKACAWDTVDWLSRMQVRPKGGRPIWRENGIHADEELALIVHEIANAIRATELQPERARSPDDETLSERVANPRQAIRMAIDRTWQPQERLTLDHIEQIIKQTITMGAPIYNEGAIQECAELYYFTAQRLSELPQVRLDAVHARGSISLGMGGVAEPSQILAGDVSDEHFALQVILSECRDVANVDEEITNSNSDNVAWDIRYVFDRALLLTAGVKKLR